MPTDPVSSPQAPVPSRKRSLLKWLGGALLALLLLGAGGAGLYAYSYFRDLHDPESRPPLFFVDHWRSQPTPRPYVVLDQAFAIPRNMLYPIWFRFPTGPIDMIMMDVLWPDLQGWSLDTWPRYMNMAVDANGKRALLDTPKDRISIAINPTTSRYNRPEIIADLVRQLEGRGVCRDVELPGWRICPMAALPDSWTIRKDLILHRPDRSDLLGSGMICDASRQEPENGAPLPHCYPYIRLTDRLPVEISFDRQRLNEAESIIARTTELICGFYRGPADGAPKPPCPQQSSRIQL